MRKKWKTRGIFFFWWHVFTKKNKACKIVLHIFFLHRGKPLQVPRGSFGFQMFVSFHFVKPLHGRPEFLGFESFHWESSLVGRGVSMRRKWGGIYKSPFLLGKVCPIQRRYTPQLRGEHFLKRCQFLSRPQLRSSILGVKKKKKKKKFN